MSRIARTDSDWVEKTDLHGRSFREIDLSGDSIGVKIEEIPPGSTSSEHHFHTLEEEHVIAIEGEATLCLGEEKFPLVAGDHVWFKAGEETAHHLENTSDTTLNIWFLVKEIKAMLLFIPNTR